MNTRTRPASHVFWHVGGASWNEGTAACHPPPFFLPVPTDKLRGTEPGEEVTNHREQTGLQHRLGEVLGPSTRLPFWPCSQPDAAWPPRMTSRKRGMC